MKARSAGSPVAAAAARSRFWFMEPDCAYTVPNEFHAFEAIGARRRSPATLFAPRTIARIAFSRGAAPTA